MYAQRLQEIAQSIWSDSEQIDEAVEFMMYYSELSDDEINNMTDNELADYMMVGVM